MGGIAVLRTNVPVGTKFLWGGKSLMLPSIFAASSAIFCFHNISTTTFFPQQVDFLKIRTQAEISFWPQHTGEGGSLLYFFPLPKIMNEKLSELFIFVDPHSPEKPWIVIHNGQEHQFSHVEIRIPLRSAFPPTDRQDIKYCLSGHGALEICPTEPKALLRAPGTPRKW